MVARSVVVYVNAPSRFWTIIGARVASNAQAGEVLVSSTVEDPVAGSGVEFAERGVAELKGIPGEWRLYAVEAAAPV